MEDLKLVLAVLSAGIMSFGGSKIAVAVILTRLDANEKRRQEDMQMLERQREEDKEAHARDFARIEAEMRRIEARMGRGGKESPW